MGYIGIMEKKMETTGIIGYIFAAFCCPRLCAKLCLRTAIRLSRRAALQPKDFNYCSRQFFLGGVECL